MVVGSAPAPFSAAAGGGESLTDGTAGLGHTAA
jgi:hypothetical protein